MRLLLCTSLLFINGLFMRNFAGALTNATGGLVDFYNIGGLAIQRTKNSLWGLWKYYSWRELAIRASLLTATVLCAAVAANTCDDDQCSSMLRGAAGAAVGFFVSHAAVMVPTVRRRLQLKNSAYELQAQTKELLVKWKTKEVENTQEINDIAEHINQFCTYLKNLALPVTKRGEGIVNLIKIKSVSRATYEQLNQLVTALEHSDEQGRVELLREAQRFWAQDHQTLFNALNQKDKVPAKNDELEATYKSTPKI